MRFLIDATVLQYPYSGIAKATLGLYAACRELDPSTQVVLAHRTGLASTPRFPTVSIRVPLPLADGRWRKLALPVLAQTVAHDFLHFPWNGHIPRFLRKTAPVVSSLMDVLPLDIPHHFPRPRDEEAYRRWIQTDLDRADLVLTISEYSRKRILDEFRVRHDPCVIPLGVYLPDPSHQPQAAVAAPAGQPFFLFSGGFDPRKRVELAIAAVCDLWRDHGLRIPLLAAGTVQLYSDELTRVFREGTEMGAVKSVGYVSDAELRRLYVEATALIYPSRYEGFGLPPLEAMANGCPVVTCRETAIPEVCGEAALYLDPARERESLVEALALLASDPAQRGKLVELGRARAARFTWRSAAQIYLGALERLGAVRGGASAPALD